MQATGLVYAGSDLASKTYASPFSLKRPSEARRGIWKKTPDLLGAFSDESLRTQPYAGMRNLGSTCYLNVFIQALFLNYDFRRAVLSSERTQHPSLLNAVRYLFGRRALGTCSRSSPLRLVSSGGPF